MQFMSKTWNARDFKCTYFSYLSGIYCCSHSKKAVLSSARNTKTEIRVDILNITTNQFNQNKFLSRNKGRNKFSNLENQDNLGGIRENRILMQSCNRVRQQMGVFEHSEFLCMIKSESVV